MTGDPRWCLPRNKSTDKMLVSFYGTKSLVSQAVPRSDCVVPLSGFAGVAGVGSEQSRRVQTRNPLSGGCDHSWNSFGG